MRPAKPHAWLEKPGVEEAILKGKPRMQVAALAGVSHQAVSLYIRKHVQPAAQRALKAHAYDELASDIGVANLPPAETGLLAKQALATEPFVARLTARYSQFDELAPKAVEAEDFRGFSSLVASETRAIELHARLAGVLDVAPVTNVQINCLMLPAKPE
jgi:hypothetical protein